MSLFPCLVKYDLITLMGYPRNMGHPVYKRRRLDGVLRALTTTA